MDWVTILSVLYAATVLVGFLLFKHWAPMYLSEKAKNLAKKEDVEELTRKVEAVL